MKVVQISNKYNQNFGFKIEAPEDFWYDCEHINRSAETTVEFKKSLDFLQKIEPDRTIILRMDREPDGWDTDFIFRAIIKSGDNYNKIAEAKNQGWWELVIKAAKKLTPKK